MNKIILEIFTDPMMGLSYESEPIIERLQKEYKELLEIRYIMCLLVKDVFDFMYPEELALGPEEGIRTYCRRLAQIYKSEESIGGLPINMDGFRLFDSKHRSSRPLNLAYEAARLSDPEKADEFLIELRHATVIDCLPTTHYDEILKVAQKSGISIESFARFYHDGSAQFLLDEDLSYAYRTGISSLPAYLFSYENKKTIIQSFHYDDFSSLISALME